MVIESLASDSVDERDRDTTDAPSAQKIVRQLDSKNVVVTNARSHKCID